jgi:hypothetical protein
MHFKKYSEHTAAEIVSFSRVMAVAFSLLAIVITWLGDWQIATATWVLAGIGGSFLVLGIASPALLRPLNHGWMSFAFVMNFFMTRLILSLIYFVLIAPLAIVFRITGKAVVTDSTSRKSYWKHYKRQAPHTHYEHLYTMSEIEMDASKPVLEPMKAESV